MAVSAKPEAKGDFCIAGVLDEIFSPENASVVLLSDDGGTGKTFGAVDIAQYLGDHLDRHFLTNIAFRQKVGPGQDDWRDIDPHPRVHLVHDMVEFWQTYAEIKRADPFAIIVPLLDEWDKWCDKVRWWDALEMAFKQWWGENRKYRTVPTVIGQQMTNNPTRPLRYVRWYISKSKRITDEYNNAFGFHYSNKQLAFIIRVRPELELEKLKSIDFHLKDVREVLLLERMDWTTDPNTAEVGDICYWSETSVNFSIGEVRGSEKWFPEFLKHISGSTPTELPDKIDEFFMHEARKPMTKKQRLEAALHIYALHLAEGAISDKGHPLMPVQLPGKRNLQEMEISLANLSRIFKLPERTLRDNFRRWDDTTKGDRS